MFSCFCNNTIIPIGMTKCFADHSEKMFDLPVKFKKYLVMTKCKSLFPISITKCLADPSEKMFDTCQTKKNP